MEAEFALGPQARGTKRSAWLAFCSEIDDWVKTLPAISQSMAENDETKCGELESMSAAGNPARCGIA